MSYEAACSVAKYAHVTGCPVQLTFEGPAKGWNAYFRSAPHAQTCFDELRDDMHEVTFAMSSGLQRII